MSGHAMTMTTTTTTSTRMYPVQPAIVLPAAFPHSSSMYKMRSLHDDAVDGPPARSCREDDAAAATDDAVVTQVIRLLQATLPEYEALEARQEKILNQLAELKKQVSTLCHFLKQSHQVESVKDPVPVKKSVIELVLHVNPKKPPYSIVALQKLWKDFNIKVVSFFHSSLRNKLPLFLFLESTGDSVNIIEFTLIWKEVPDIEFVMNPQCCPIRGEVNFLRLVSRLVESHNYESTCSQPHTLDYALDFTNLLHHQQCIKEGLITLANDFERWSCKGGFNIADIAVWSLIKQFHETDLPPVLHKWYALCESTFMEKFSK